MKGGMHNMLRHVFAEMNSMLDEIVKHYPSAQGPRKEELIHKWNLLRRMSDSVMDEWLAFEEKMGKVAGSGILQPANDASALPEMGHEAFIRGQGYYRLMMYREALAQFGKVDEFYPQSLLVQMYAAMSHMHLNQLEEAESLFHYSLGLTESRPIKAAIYNALGCVRAKKNEPDQAVQHFMLALEFDPALKEAHHNMEACRSDLGRLRYSSHFMAYM
jgi:tetratricopeptide (TPR) repeat protein